MNFPLSHDFKQVGGLQQDLHTELSLGWLTGSTDYRNLSPGTALTGWSIGAQLEF